MIEMEHYVAIWEYFDESAHFNGAPQSFFRKSERFSTREEAIKKAEEELKKFKEDTEPVSEMKWFKEIYLDHIDDYFKVCEAHKIY